MEEIYESNDEQELKKQEEWDRMLAQMRMEKARKKHLEKLIIRLGIPSFAGIILLITVIILMLRGCSLSSFRPVQAEIEKAEFPTDILQDDDTSDANDEEPVHTYKYVDASDKKYLGSDNMTSSNAILIDVSTGEIIGEKDGRARIVPASMTKVLTLLVAVENIENIHDKVKVTDEATDYAYINDCSSVGFDKQEEVTVEDLLYGTILCSGADAAYQLALYVAGSHDAFVDMMNDKLEQLGIGSTTHFTNCAGIHDSEHYSTCLDIAVIMNAAIDDELCSKILNARRYTTSSTPEHPEGIGISNWFLRRIEDKDTGGEVLGAKTGYVSQSGSCSVSYAVQNSGRRLIAVTADARGNWRCIYDHVDIYANCQ